MNWLNRLLHGRAMEGNLDKELRFQLDAHTADLVARGVEPAEAHRHYDQALSLWERVTDPEKLAGMSRARLGFKSAETAADSGELRQDDERPELRYRPLRDLLRLARSLSRRVERFVGARARGYDLEV